MMDIIKYPKKEDWGRLLDRPLQDTGTLDNIVLPVLADIKMNGDPAVRKYIRKFEGACPDNLMVTEDEIKEGVRNTYPELKNAIDRAYRNIESFHRAQYKGVKRITTAKGITCWQRSIAIEKVGIYVPGGSAPLFSTVLMLAIPANIAECNDIIICSPAGPDGKLHPAILYAAYISGVSKIFKIGGAQAIAAMAYGTETVPKVYKIFGPGNQYIMAAKQIVAMHDVAIDMPAGPSEVMVIADSDTPPEFAAVDLLSQAEHGPDSQVMLLTTHPEIIKRVSREVKRQLELLPRREIACKSLENSKMIVLSDDDQIMEMVNEYAPEHLIIATKNAEELAEKVINAGSVFIGIYTPESAGDYISGTNHTLPTNGYAKFYNGVNLDNYVKKITFQQITEEGILNSGNSIMIMAEAEKLDAHKNAAGLRLKYLRKEK